MEQRKPSWCFSAVIGIVQYNLVLFLVLHDHTECMYIGIMRKGIFVISATGCSRRAILSKTGLFLMAFLHCFFFESYFLFLPAILSFLFFSLSLWKGVYSKGFPPVPSALLMLRSYPAGQFSQQGIKIAHKKKRLHNVGLQGFVLTRHLSEPGLGEEQTWS